MASKRMKSGSVAIIDIGSNTVRVCVYRVNEGKSSFKKVIDARDFVGLSSYVNGEGVMSDQGIVAGGKAVAKMVRMSRMAGFDQVHAFATAALRNCTNSKEVVEAIEQAANCNIRVLSGKDEARLSTTGALRSTTMRSGLFFDLGGGSTELAGISCGKMVEWDSIPMGSLSGWFNSYDGVIPSALQIENTVQAFSRHLNESSVCISKYSSVCAIGGVSRLAAKVISLLNGEKSSGRNLSLSDLERIMDLARTSPDDLTRMVLRIKPARVHTFVPGCAILYAILLESGCNAMEIAKTGIREGYLLSEVMGLKDFDDPRLLLG